MSTILRHEVEFWAPSKTKNTYGEVEKAPALFLKCRARVLVAAAKEEEDADQIQAVVTYTVRIRFRPGIDAEMVIKWKGRELEIKGIKPDVKQTWLDLICEER